MANRDSWRESRERSHHHSDNPRPVSALPGDYLYGERRALRAYRDFSRDEHRRFAADFERRHGGTARIDALTEYDRVDPSRSIADAMRRYAVERGEGALLRDDRRRYRRDTSRSEAQQHRGRGPRGYQRSDQRIYEDVCEVLTDDERIDPSDIEVAVRNGEVTLSGTIRSRAAKRRATDVIEHIAGVKDVYNNIRIWDEQLGVGYPRPRP